MLAAMDKTQITALLRCQILNLWNDGMLEIVDRHYAPDVVDHMPVPGQASGLAALKQVVVDFRTAIPDLQMTLLGTIACGDLGVDFWTLTGTHRGALFGMPASGKPVRFSGIDMIRVAHGRIVELWHVEEMLQFFAQIGGSEMPVAAPIQEAAPRPAIPDPSLLDARERRILGIVRAHIEQVRARGDPHLAHQLYAPDVIDHMPAPDQRSGIPGQIEGLGRLREAAPDLTLTAEHYVVKGDLAAARWVMRGTHTGAPLLDVPACGNRFEINGMDVIRVRPDFTIGDVWHVEELASLRSQILASAP